MKDLLVDVHVFIVETLNLNISRYHLADYATELWRTCTTIIFPTQIIVLWRCLLWRREPRLPPFQNESSYGTIQLEISLIYLTQKNTQLLFLPFNGLSRQRNSISEMSYLTIG